MTFRSQCAKCVVQPRTAEIEVGIRIISSIVRPLEDVDVINVKSICRKSQG